MAAETSPVEPTQADIAGWREARRRTGAMLVALDFDGTLAPIVAHADQAAPAESTVRAVAALARRRDTRVAVISGRGLEDAARRLPIDGLAWAGNHGLEIRGPGIEHIHPGARAAAAELARCRTAVEQAIAGIEGAWVEDKGLTLSVHYRATPEPLHARVVDAVRGAAHATDGLRLTEGKRVVEIRPDVDWDKGRALAWIIDALDVPAASPVLYIGDDRTDEDAFRALRGRGAGILVGDPRPSAASFRVASTAAVESLIERLAADA
jgi:trehalose 6-phosphate phosphatase